MFQFKSIAAAIAIAAVAATAVPASARPNLNGAQKVRATIEQRDGKSVYCVSQEITGSFIPQKSCFSQDELARSGNEGRALANALALADRRA